MRRTEFRSPHGLDDRGRSTPARPRAARPCGERDARRSRRSPASGSPRSPSPSGRPRRIQNRNAMLWLYPGAFGTKTGFTALAGPTLIASASREGRELVAIVLDAPAARRSPTRRRSSTTGSRRSRSATLVAAGRPRSARSSSEAGRSPAPQASALEGLVPSDADVATTIAVDPDAAFPPAPGQRIGTRQRPRRRAPRRRGRRSWPAEVPPPRPLEGPWWARGAVGRCGTRLTGTVGGARGRPEAVPGRRAGPVLGSARMTDIASVLYAREDVRRRVEELGAQITGDYAGRTPVLVSVLKGGAMFLADLVPRRRPAPRGRVHGDQPLRRGRGVARAACRSSSTSTSTWRAAT